jgi:hypothetical protein
VLLSCPRAAWEPCGRYNDERSPLCPRLDLPLFERRGPHGGVGREPRRKTSWPGSAAKRQDAQGARLVRYCCPDGAAPDSTEGAQSYPQYGPVAGVIKGAGAPRRRACHAASWSTRRSRPTRTAWRHDLKIRCEPPYQSHASTITIAPRQQHGTPPGPRPGSFPRAALGLGRIRTFR